MEFKVPGTKAENYSKLKNQLSYYISSGKIPFIAETQWNDADCQVSCSGTGFKAKIECLDENIKIELDLNFALKMMKGQIEEQIQRMIEKIFR